MRYPASRPRTGESASRRPWEGRVFQEVSKPMAKNLFRGMLGALVATIAGIALTACNSCCDPCTGGPKVYKKPCCAQGGYQSCGAKSCGGAVAPAPMGTPAPMPAPAAGGQKSCGAGKCG